MLTEALREENAELQELLGARGIPGIPDPLARQQEAWKEVRSRLRGCRK